MNYYRNRTPLVMLFRELDTELINAEKIVYRVGWFASHAYQIAELLKPVDPDLSREMMSVLEGHPAVPYGLSGLGLETMCICRAVDTFQAVLVGFVGEVFKQDPDTLVEASSGRVDVSELLRAKSITDVRQVIAGQVLFQLGAFKKVREFLGRLGLKVKLSPGTDRLINEAIALRNIVAHNGGRVNSTYLQRTGRTDVNIGDRIQVDEEQFIDTITALRTGADAFQMTLGNKYFGLGDSQITGYHIVFRKRRGSSK